LCHYDNPAFIDPQVPLPLAAPTKIVPDTFDFETTPTTPEFVVAEIGCVAVNPPDVPT
jgi:hypothetical protein